jgi:hypothetical protein
MSIIAAEPILSCTSYIRSISLYVCLCIPAVVARQGLSKLHPPLCCLVTVRKTRSRGNA